MSLKISGEILKVFPNETVKGRKGEWIRQPFILTTKDQYSKNIYFEAIGKLSEVVNELKQGKEVTVYFNIESREHNNRWFTKLKAWKVEVGINK